MMAVDRIESCWTRCCFGSMDYYGTEVDNEQHEKMRGHLYFACRISLKTKSASAYGCRLLQRGKTPAFKESKSAFIISVSSDLPFKCLL